MDRAFHIGDDLGGRGERLRPAQLVVALCAVADNAAMGIAVAVDRDVHKGLPVGRDSNGFLTGEFLVSLIVGTLFRLIAVIGLPVHVASDLFGRHHGDSDRLVGVVGDRHQVFLLIDLVGDREHGACNRTELGDHIVLGRAPLLHGC